MRPLRVFFIESKPERLKVREVCRVFDCVCAHVPDEHDYYLIFGALLNSLLETDVRVTLLASIGDDAYFPKDTHRRKINHE